VLSIRQAELHEREALRQLQYRASLVWDEYRELLLADPDAIDIPVGEFAAGRIFVAERDGVAVGFAVTLQREDGDSELDGLFVEPGAWRTGIGTVLVHEAQRRAAGEGAALLHVIANPLAEAFYLACGFAFSGAVQTRFGAARTMKKLLG
jgi:GNAT superfamily N-acetyltransferase